MLTHLCVGQRLLQGSVVPARTCNCPASADEARLVCRGRRGLVSFLQLGIIVLGICGLSFGPFIERGQLWQVEL